jgi:hypothetical protein
MSEERRKSGKTAGSAGKSVDSESFKVTDRRKFHPSGDLRESAGEPRETTGAHEQDRPASTPAQDQPPAPPGAAPPPAGKAAGEPSAGKAAGEPSAGTQAGDREPLDFRFIVYNLYMSALQMLGVPTQAGAQAVDPDLERARYFVEFLQVLEAKTKGNLAEGESRMLTEVLYDLRMKFVEISGQKSG